MTTSVLDRVPLDEITAQAREIRFWRTVLTIIGGVIFGTAWLAAKGFTVLWLALAWGVTAAKLGWQAGRPAPQPHGPSSLS